VVTVIPRPRGSNGDFARLNSAGTKVTEADIALALAASQNPGWARESFCHSSINSMRPASIDPNLMFRSVVAIGLGRAVLQDVPRTYGASHELGDASHQSKDGWQHTVQYVEGRGILRQSPSDQKCSDPVGGTGVRVSKCASRRQSVCGVLRATRTGRYGGSAITSVQNDVQTVTKSMDLDEALSEVHRRLASWESFQAEDFLVPYTDRVLRLFVYLIMFDRQAQDWLKHTRLGFSIKSY